MFEEGKGTKKVKFHLYLIYKTSHDKGVEELRNGVTILDFSISWDRSVGIATRIRIGVKV
jgi:hypothetical protein